MVGAVEREVGRAVNWASIRFNRGRPGGGLAVPGGGPGRAEVVADDRDADLGQVEGAQVAAEPREPGPGLARLDVPVQLVLAQFVSSEQVPYPLGAGVGPAHPRPRPALRGYDAGHLGRRS